MIETSFNNWDVLRTLIHQIAWIYYNANVLKYNKNEHLTKRIFFYSTVLKIYKDMNVSSKIIIDSFPKKFPSSNFSLYFGNNQLILWGRDVCFNQLQISFT